MISLEGRHAIVTGATQGLGADIAERLHQAGARLTIAGRDPERGEAIAARLGEGALFVETDIADDGSIAACVTASASPAAKVASDATAASLSQENPMFRSVCSRFVITCNSAPVGPIRWPASQGSLRPHMARNT